MPRIERRLVGVPEGLFGARVVTMSWHGSRGGSSSAHRARQLCLGAFWSMVQCAFGGLLVTVRGAWARTLRCHNSETKDGSPHLRGRMRGTAHLPSLASRCKILATPAKTVTQARFERGNCLARPGRWCTNTSGCTKYTRSGIRLLQTRGRSGPNAGRTATATCKRLLALVASRHTC